MDRFEWNRKILFVMKHHMVTHIFFKNTCDNTEEYNILFLNVFYVILYQLF